MASPPGELLPKTIMLISGINGQDVSRLAEPLPSKGHEADGIDMRDG